LADKKEPTGPKARKIPVDLSLLNADDKKALREEARKSIVADMEQAARDAYYAEEMAKLRRGKIPEEQYVQVSIDAPRFVPFYMLDGVQFYHGYTYEVRRSQAEVLLEQMQRSWNHQDQIDGRGRLEHYRQPGNMRIGLQHAGTVTRGVNGAVNAEI
jgi:hypothetical protein